MSNAIPSGWEIKTLDEVATVFAGGTPSRSNPAYYDGSVPWVKSGEVNKRLIYRTEEAISELAVKESSAKWAKRGSVLVAMYGATAGKVAKLMIDATLNQAVSAVNRKSETTDNDFLFYAIENNSRELLNTVQGSGQPNLSGQLIKSLNLPIPPFPEQQKIATILSSVDNVIEKTRAQIDKLKDLKTGMMQELLTKGIGHTEFKDSPVGRIPESWSVVEIQNIATVVRGASPRPQGDPRFYGGNVPRLMVKDVTRDGKYVTPKIDFLTEAGAKLSRPMPAGTLTIVCSGTVGVPSFLNVNACIHDGFLALKDIASSCDTEFLYYQLLPMQAIFDSSATHGGIFTNLTTQILKEFTIVLPPLSEQQEIAKKLSGLDELLLLRSIKLTKLQFTKKALMQDLLTGKVRVKLQKDMLKNVE